VNKRVLWWGRSDIDYSRNRVVRQIFSDSDWEAFCFSPNYSRYGCLQARFTKLPDVGAIWVPCFRQRDLAAALKYGHKKKIPVVFDPLISAYDKQVFERKKFPESSRKARKLLCWERTLFQQADLVLADTWEHARFFSELFEIEEDHLAVVPVGAEEELFKPASNPQSKNSCSTVLFYGSFLNLQGPETIIEAARQYSGPPVCWKLIGEGPLLEECRRRAEGLSNVEFSPWLSYEQLPSVINQADVLLGIFGTSAKASRVIPNKVYQSLACGKPLVTRSAPAYPDSFKDNENLGIAWVPPGDPASLAKKIADLLAEPDKLSDMGNQSRRTYEKFFSKSSISASLFAALEPLLKQ
jgi:glycosyltransferase involved in cell wall biosynthesis